MAGIEFEYWDSCIFIAYLQKEDGHRAGELKYIQEQAQKFDMGTLGIVTSTITVTEIYETRLTPEQHAKFRSMYSRSNFQFIDAGMEVCKIASEIRGYYKANPVLNENNVGHWPTTPDAIHIASAIGVQKQFTEPIKLITLDSKNKAKFNELALTKMSGLVANKWPLIICRPPLPPQQTSFLYDQPATNQPSAE